jgi:hypothetical protein
VWVLGHSTNGTYTVLYCTFARSGQGSLTQITLSHTHRQHSKHSTAHSAAQKLRSPKVSVCTVSLSSHSVLQDLSFYTLLLPYKTDTERVLCTVRSVRAGYEGYGIHMLEVIKRELCSEC